MPLLLALDRIFKPARPALAAARAAVSGHTDPRAAWEALLARGLLPETWRDDPGRRFPWFFGRSARERAEALRRAPHVPRSPFPDDVDACALLAADIEGIERAEAAGRALVSAMQPWGVPAATAVLWIPTSRSAYGHQIHDTKPGTWEPDGVALFIVRQTRWEDVQKVIDRLAHGGSAPIDPRREALAATVGVWVFAAERWAEAVREGRRTPRGQGPADTRFADLPDPFAHALRIFEAGYALMPSGDDLLVLGYPVDD